MKAKGELKTSYFELCVSGELRNICAYTSESALTIAEEHWRALLVGDGKLEVRLRELGPEDAQPIAATPIQISLAAATAQGTLYYAEQESGLVRRAAVSATSSETTPLTLPKDSFVYAASANGKRLALLGDGGTLELRALAGLDLLVSISLAELGCMNPSSLAFDPSGRRLALACSGALVLLDVDTGDALPVMGALASEKLSHPAWSPDGRYLVFAQWPVDAMPEERELEGTSIARSAVAIDGSFGAAQVLVASEKRDDTYAFPAYSPDGDYLAFVRSKGKLRDGKEARLMLSAAEGGAPTLLSVFSEEKMKPVGGGGLSAPVWIGSDERGLAWLVFSGVGPVSAQAQLWVMAVHLGEAEPGRAAVWLPFQGPERAGAGPVFAAD
jgi:hypothetical protein